ncbi:hypothetical protein NQZ79_g4921 [Umbelopsis isabellina]|nr:hypothetical protein NQZ79_g4921 [Umbelopsis isabellina]
MDQQAVEKPSLPSIKYILGDADPLFDSHRHLPQSNGSAFNTYEPHKQHSLPSVVPNEHRRYTHQRNARSVSSMLDFQRLSLAPPQPQRPRTPEPPFTPESSRPLHPNYGQPQPPFHPQEHSNSYIMSNGSNPMHPSHTQRARTSHARSLSEFSHPYPQPSTLSPHPSPPREHLPQRAIGHRRAVSANTVDSMLNPKPWNLAPRPAAYLDTESNGSQATPATTSPPESYDENDSEEDSRSSSPPSSGTNNRYVCPYCSKGFSRPSSLRIHTYSHTGEKPFVCSEDGCGRRFSVQSNMRRHLRVHKLGRQVKKPSNPSSLSQVQRSNDVRN